LKDQCFKVIFILFVIIFTFFSEKRKNISIVRVLMLSFCFNLAVCAGLTPHFLMSVCCAENYVVFLKML